ncbi:hypothetical protein KC363_g5504 [Hortaea werneckii]|nr:hypothetical protein KC361_g2077 [Hortaea werneckii]KAI6884810.1 hypothetical protein KC325_g4013 [Hortaea werneckii]KAI6994399.1 hypothetical protein KC359_g4690 [Hortaea werneckii]KAI7146155.1 hypothetical protein KC344_g3859 [Hortaea werneckii]KAI7174908.1 hypothetical protein KC360_g4040 [Hortaea werneckii]
MAPRIPEEPVRTSKASLEDVRSESDLDEAEEEFHTEGSGDDEDIDDEELKEYHTEGSEDDEDVAQEPKPFLPEHLLSSTSEPAQRSLKNVPWEQLTANQRRNQKEKARRARKRAAGDLQEEGGKTGGALNIRNVAKKVESSRSDSKTSKSRVKKGRVEKSTRPIISGRQNILEARKRQSGPDAAPTGLKKNLKKQRKSRQAKR